MPLYAQPKLTAAAFHRGRSLPRVLAALLLFGSGVFTAQAQSIVPGSINPFNATSRGIHLYDVSIFGSYMSSVLPTNSFIPGNLSLGADGGLGGSASLGWSRQGEHSALSVLYSASYTGMIRYSDLNALSQFFALNGSRRLGRKWIGGLSLSSGVSNAQTFLFDPPLLSRVADVPASFDDLAAAMTAGKYSNDQLGSLLTGAPVVDSPGRVGLFGNRMFGSSVRGNLEYEVSPRLSLSFSLEGLRAQHLNGPTRHGEEYIVPVVTSGTGTVEASYGLSRRTRVGVSAGSTRIVSRFQDSYSSTATASIGRTLGRRWFIELGAGAGVITPIRATYAVKPGPHYTGSGSVGYKTFAHTFLLSAGRTIVDQYGLGAGTLNGAAAWEWRRPGRSWGFFSNAGWQRMQSALLRLDGWHASTGLTKRLNRQTSLSLMYAYMRTSSRTGVNPFDRDVSGVRAVLSWSPGGER